MSSNVEEVWTLKQAAAFLKITPQQVTRYKVPHFALGHKTKLFLRSDVLAWLQTKREQRFRINPTNKNGE